MWNYTYMVPSFLVLLIFLIYYQVLPRIPSRLNISFLGVLSLETLVMVLDMASSYAVEYYLSYPRWLVVWLNMGFFVFYLARAFSYYLFTINILGVQYQQAKTNVHLTNLVFLVSELITLSSLWTGAVFRIGDQGYARGPVYHLIYVEFLFCIFASLQLIFSKGKELRRFDYYSAVGFQMILLIGNVVRLLLPSHLIMNTFCLLAIIVMYLTFVNPDLYFSQQNGAFNRKAMTSMLDEYIRIGRHFGMLAFVLRNYFEDRDIYGGAQMDQGIAMIGRYLTERYPKLKVFYVQNGRFVMIGSAATDWNRIREEIDEKFRKPWVADDAELYLSAGFVHLNSNVKLNSVEKVTSVLRSTLNQVSQGDAEDEIVLDATIVDKLEQQRNVKRVLEFALEQHQVEIFLQPLVRSSDHALVGAEALARIRDAQGNIIPPGQFIPLAERNGRINELGEQVLEKTCQFIQAHPLETLGLSWINVNLSPIQCMKTDLNQRFSSIMQRYGVPADQVRLEITEESMVDHNLLQQQIAVLQASGFRFVLDDYGSSYSNISRVKRYPFINIKLDMEMVWEHFNHPDVLLPTIVNTFKDMHFDIVAEGVETKEMADALRNMGCDYLQGFYFSRPLPVADFVEKYSKQ